MIRHCPDGAFLSAAQHGYKPAILHHEILELDSSPNITYMNAEIPIQQISDSTNKAWLKHQTWNQPRYNAIKMREHAEQGMLMGAAPVGYKKASRTGISLGSPGALHSVSVHPLLRITVTAETQWRLQDHAADAPQLVSRRASQPPSA